MSALVKPSSAHFSWSCLHCSEGSWALRAQPRVSLPRGHRLPPRIRDGGQGVWSLLSRPWRPPGPQRHHPESPEEGESAEHVQDAGGLREARSGEGGLPREAGSPLERNPKPVCSSSSSSSRLAWAI
eukprot:scaffold75_cov217-Pinguiococcus_pyrenoidosus.AAC.15